MRIVIIAISILALSSCSSYQKVLKKGTPSEKLEAAKKYYNKKEYAKAEPLFDDLMTLYFGKSEREEIYYYYAYTNYGLSNYLIAGYYFRNFVKAYPTSKFKEEATYMGAICDYHKTLEFELDQSGTNTAIGSLQSFINLYPNSTYVEECNKRIDELRKRVVKKAYYSAKLYYQLEQYKAAVVACTNALSDYPDMINRDELMYIIANSAYIYADKSIEEVQLERFEDASKYVDNYLKEYDDTNSYHSKIIKIQKRITDNITRIENNKA